jgi:hypothetical protein
MAEHAAVQVQTSSGISLLKRSTLPSKVTELAYRLGTQLTGSRQV